MNLEHSKNGNLAKLTLQNDLISNDDFRAFKQVILQYLDEDADVEILMQDTNNISSAAVGFFLKIIYDDKKNVTINVTTENLYKTFKRLQLLDKLNIQKI